MQKICKKYAQICKATDTKKYAKICKKYALICTDMQNMQSGILYAEYARICTPHFADVEKNIIGIIGISNINKYIYIL